MKSRPRNDEEPKKGRLDPAWGTVLVGAIGIVATAYTANSNTRSAAKEARAAERRAEIRKAYLGAITAVNACNEKANAYVIRTEVKKTPDTTDPLEVWSKNLVPNDVDSAVRLFGSPAAIKAWDKMMFDYGGLIAGFPKARESYAPSAKAFMDTVRAEVQADNF